MVDKEISQDFIYKTNEEVLPEIFWSDVPISKETYRFTFLDFGGKWVESSRDRKNYWVFKAYAIEACNSLDIPKGKIFDFHVPKKAFFRGYNKCMTRQRLVAGDDCDLVISFRRLGERSMDITKLEYYFNNEKY